MTITRRKILGSGLAATATLATPTVLTARRTTRSGIEDLVIGEGEFQYRVNHAFCKLPDRFSWQTTHNVAVDSANHLYVIHEGRSNQKDHPSIFVFDDAGEFVRSFGSQFQGGGHGLEIRKEGGEEFLYVAAYQQVKSFAKLTLKGEVVWYRKAPMESGVYEKGEHLSMTANWTRSGFLPTNFAFLDDGGFLLADGYGSFYIHRFDSEGDWIGCFGGPGEGQGTFDTSHGLWVDRRDQNRSRIVVTDRARNTLQTFSMEGKYQSTMSGFGLPANIDTWKNLMLVPELKARLSLLNEKDEVVATLGDGRTRLTEIKGLRGQPDQWQPGEFVHPHDACFDAEGNIFVAEWVSTGRVTKLTKV